MTNCYHFATPDTYNQCHFTIISYSLPIKIQAPDILHTHSYELIAERHSPHIRPFSTGSRIRSPILGYFTEILKMKSVAVDKPYCFMCDARSIPYTPYRFKAYRNAGCLDTRNQDNPVIIFRLCRRSWYLDRVLGIMVCI